MKSLTLSFKKFVSAAKAADYEVHTRMDRCISWRVNNHIPVNNLFAERELEDRGVRANEEYAALLRLVDGVGIRHTGQKTHPRLFCFTAPCFSDCIAVYDFNQSQLQVGHPLQNQFSCFFDPYRNQVGWNTTLPIKKLSESSVEDNESEVVFHSFANFFDCMRAAVVDGIDMNERESSTDAQAERDFERFHAICNRETGLPAWL